MRQALKTSEKWETEELPEACVQALMSVPIWMNEKHVIIFMELFFFWLSELQTEGTANSVNTAIIYCA